MSRFAGSPLSGMPTHWEQTKFGYEFVESTERAGESPEGSLLSISEHRGVELNSRTTGQQASLDASKYRVVHPGQLAANMMWLNHGGLGVSDRRGYISPDYKAFWISNRFEPRYVHYLLRSTRYVDYFSVIGTGVRPNAQRVAKTVLDAMPMPLPLAERQRAIVDYLDRETGEIDAMLGKMDELTASLEARRDAVVMKAVEGHFNGPTVPLAFASDPENFFDGDWVESKDQDPNGEVRLLQLADIGVGKFLDKSDRYVNQEAFDRLACREIIPGDVLIARMPDPLARACVLPAGLDRTITVVDVAVVRTDQAKMIPAYLAYALNSLRFRTLIESLQGGSTRQRISRSRLGQQRIPSVDLDTQRATVDHLDEATAKIDAMLAKVADLKSLLRQRRAALITDVVIGTKEVA